MKITLEFEDDKNNTFLMFLKEIPSLEILLQGENGIEYQLLFSIRRIPQHQQFEIQKQETCQHNCTSILRFAANLPEGIDKSHAADYRPPCPFHLKGCQVALIGELQ
ncbi:MAG TPA: hypothetical protein PK323_11945 [Bacteroidia bacterium]|nr:hypothetical protein [Bacteroidia bacterium]